MAKAKHIYIAQIEVRPLPGCQMSPEVGGAFTTCFIPALTEEEAQSIMRAALEEDHYRLVDTEHFLRYSREDWDDQDGKIKSGVAEARATGELVYGEFHCWPHDAPDNT
jgi:hypothetical protein